MSDYTTKDCVLILDKWLIQQNQTQGLGQWKRVKKNKNAQGLWSRLFENKVNLLMIEILETPLGLVVIEPKAQVGYLTPTQNTSMAEMYNKDTLYDKIGSKLHGNDAEKTMKYYLGLTNLTCIWNGQDDEDDNGIAVTCYSYVDDNGRNYALLVYSDGSWVIFSD